MSIPQLWLYFITLKTPPFHKLVYLDGNREFIFQIISFFLLSWNSPVVLVPLARQNFLCDSSLCKQNPQMSQVSKGLRYFWFP